METGTQLGDEGGVKQYYQQTMLTFVGSFALLILPLTLMAYCPKTRACTFSSRLAVIVTQDSTQALAAFDRAMPWDWIELGPDELVPQPWWFRSW